LNSRLEEDVNVLFVDDDENFNDLARDFFSREECGINLIVCGNPENVIDEIESKDIDAVVSDYKMPTMNGFELFEKIRERWDDIPFIILTGEGEEDVAMEALNRGVDQYHIKRKNPIEQFKILSKSILEEVVRVKGKRELESLNKRVQELREDLEG